MGTSDVEYDREDAEHPTWAKITVFREVNGRVCEFPATARWKEYASYKKDGQPMALWKKMPYLMLGKCAEALAIRKAFPQELAGIYTFEEMDQPAGSDVQVAAPQIPNNDKEQQPSEVKKEEQTVLLGPEKPASEKPAKKRRLAVVEERTDTPEKAQSNYARLLEFLHLGKYTGADFLMVARKNKWLSESIEKLADVPDPDLAEFLKPDNREIIMEQLEKMPRHVKD
jgi:hypothetical protein